MHILRQTIWQFEINRVVISKLADHSMFQDSAKTDILKMCEDCRVEAMFEQKDKMMEMRDRPKPRTTDDYLN